jgi:hypothetical protein
MYITYIVGGQCILAFAADLKQTLPDAGIDVKCLWTFPNSTAVVSQKWKQGRRWCFQQATYLARIPCTRTRRWSGGEFPLSTRSLVQEAGCSVISILRSIVETTSTTPLPPAPTHCRVSLESQANQLSKQRIVKWLSLLRVAYSWRSYVSIFLGKLHINGFYLSYCSNVASQW